MSLKISKLLQVPLLSSAIFLGSQATAQEKEVKPQENKESPTYIYPKYFDVQNPWKPNENNPFIWDPKNNNENLFKNFNRQNYNDDGFNFDDDLRNKNDDDLIRNIFIVGISGSVFLGLFLVMFSRLKKYAQQKGKEFEEFLSENEQYNKRQTTTRKQSARERECRTAVLKILKQRGGIDPSIYK